MNRLSTARRCQVPSALVEGVSVRGAVRLTGVSKPTILKLLADVGDVATTYQDRVMRGLPCRRIQCDEIWQFCYAKTANLPEHKRGQLGYGDVWTWVALDADTKLVPAWRVGTRDLDCARNFIRDLRGRLRYRVQLTTDGHLPYVDAVERAFGAHVDYAMLTKDYGGGPSYSPSVRKAVVSGAPAPAYISTSFVERQNLAMRTSMRRFTRQTNGFSPKLANHLAAVALHFLNYNFVRVQRGLRVTSAMAAEVADHVWDIREIVGLLEAAEARAA